MCVCVCVLLLGATSLSPELARAELSWFSKCREEVWPNILVSLIPLYLEVYSTLQLMIDALKILPSSDPIAADTISSFHFSSL